MYTSPQTQNSEIAPKGVWQAHVLGQERRLQFSCDPLTYQVVVSALTKIGTDKLIISTGVAGADGAVRPWTHGYAEGDVVQFHKGKANVVDAVLIRDSATGKLTWNKSIVFEKVSSTCNIDNVQNVTSIILAVPQTDQLVVEITCATAAISQSNSWSLIPQGDVYPTLLLDREFYAKSIDPAMLGLPKNAPIMQGADAFDTVGQSGAYMTAIVYGTAGDLSRGTIASPPRQFPLSAWSIYRMDPPEILIIELNDNQMRTKTNLQHICASDIKATLARINLSSLYREGDLRSELLNSSGDALSTIKLSLKNPDISVYQSHNSTWTFSLNLII